MALEIERKFLVENGGWRAAVEESRHIVQAYMALDGDVSLQGPHHRPGEGAPHRQGTVRVP